MMKMGEDYSTLAPSRKIAGPRATTACEPRQVRKEAAAAVTGVCCGSTWLSLFPPRLAGVPRSILEYRVLARKWRPQVFEDVLGQEHVVRTL